METKICNKCSVEKELTQFTKSKRIKSGYEAVCKECKQHNNRINSRIWYSKNSDKARGYRIKRNFNLSIDEYVAMFKQQKGLCKICGLSNIHKKRLAVDHNHTTGEVRGLLCDNCNRGIGLFRDNTEFLATAIKYLLKDL